MKKQMGNCLERMVSVVKNNFLAYAFVGTLPGRMQEKHADKNEKNRRFYCRYSLGAVALTISARYLFGE